MAGRVPADAFDVDDEEVPDWIPAAAPKLMRQVRREWERLTPEMVPWPGDHPDQAMHLVNTLEDFLAYDEERLRREAPRFLLAFSRPNVRDIALVQWACDLHVGLRETVRAQNWDGVVKTRGPGTNEHAARAGSPTGPPSVRAAIAALMVLVPLAEDWFRLGPLTMIGWLHWALGHGPGPGSSSTRPGGSTRTTAWPNCSTPGSRPVRCRTGPSGSPRNWLRTTSPNCMHNLCTRDTLDACP